MRLHRFYIQEKLKVGEVVTLNDERVVHQIKNVFRLGVGDSVILFCGDGFDYVSKITEVKKDGLVFSLGEPKEVSKIKKDIHVYLACIRKERFEWAVEKLTELGVSSITPVETERSEHTYLNIERLKKIAIEASEQCGRGNVPEVKEVSDLKSLVSGLGENILVADFGGKKINDFEFTSLLTCNLFIGPEGGWSEGERELFNTKKVKTVSLGETVLRAETATIVGVAILTQQDSQRS